MDGNCRTEGHHLRSTGRTCRVSDGQTVVTEGPAVAAGTELNGYYTYDAPDLDAAIAFAARIPVARMGARTPPRSIGSP